MLKYQNPENKRFHSLLVNVFMNDPNYEQMSGKLQFGSSLSQSQTLVMRDSHTISQVNVMQCIPCPARRGLSKDHDTEIIAVIGDIS